MTLDWLFLKGFHTLPAGTCALHYPLFITATQLIQTTTTTDDSAATSCQAVNREYYPRDASNSKLIKSAGDFVDSIVTPVTLSSQISLFNLIT